MYPITIVGTGYVGLVTGACLADFGNHVVCVDRDAERIARTQNLEIPFFEPGLPELVRRNVSEGRLSFSSDLAQALKGAAVVFITVGTPPRRDGSADTRPRSSRQIARSSVTWPTTPGSPGCTARS